MSELTEEEARNMEAGEELDRICAGWMGIDCHWPSGEPYVPKFSSRWSDAGSLLMSMKVMRETEVVFSVKSKGEAIVEVDDLPATRTGGHFHTSGPPCLAIARTCAVLVARGITREDVEGSDE